MSSSSDERDRGCPGTGGAAELWEGQDEGELAHAVARELGELEVLDNEDAVVDVQDLRHLERAGGILSRHWPVAPRVAAGQGDTLCRKPLGELESWAWFAREIRVRVVPVAPPAGVEE